MGIGASALIALLNNVPAGSSLYFDRYFTSEAPLDYLLEHNISGTGTVIKSRLSRGITFKEDSAMKKEDRGTFQVFERDDQKMCATKWLDNKPVFLLSTVHAATPVDTVKRWSRKIEITLMCDVHQLYGFTTIVWVAWIWQTEWSPSTE